MNNKEQNKVKTEELEEHLSEKFRQLQPELLPPPELKKSVFDTLDTLQLFADLADLFTVKFASSETRLLGLMDFLPEEKNDNDPSGDALPPPAGS